MADERAATGPVGRPITRRLTLRVLMSFCAPLLASACLHSNGEQTPQTRPALSERASVDPARPLPIHLASGAAGKVHFEAHCTACHGSDGRGDGPLGRTLRPAPPNFRDPAATADASPVRYFDAIGNGVMGSPMKRFDHVLDESERWDTAFYLWSLRAESDDFSVGADVYSEACSDCHGADGRGVLTAPLDIPDRVEDSRLDLTKRIEAAHAALLLGRSPKDTSALVEYLYAFLYSPAAVSLDEDSLR